MLPIFFGKNDLMMNDKLKDYCTIKEKCLGYFVLTMDDELWTYQ